MTDQTKTTDTSKDQSTKADDKKVDAKPDDKTLLNQKPAGALEKYESFKVPDGLTIEPKALEEATTVFKGLNLSQDQAQSLVDFHAKQMSALAEAPMNAIKNLKSTWESEVRANYGKAIEPGGEVHVRIARMIDAMPKELASSFREVLDHTFAGSNLAFVKGFDWLSQQFAEGTTVRGNNPSPLGQKGPDARPLSVAQALYPHLPSSGSR